MDRGNYIHLSALGSALFVLGHVAGQTFLPSASSIFPATVMNINFNLLKSLIY